MSDCISSALRAHCPLQFISFLNHYSFSMERPVVLSHREEEIGGQTGGDERDQSRHRHKG